MALILVIAAATVFATGPVIAEPPASMRLVLLGTGNPNPEPERSGPSLAVVVGEKSYIVDFGPGLVRRATAASRRHNIPALEARSLEIGLLTHLHSDHTAGFPDLILTPWVMERELPLRVFGPSGLKAMAGHILKAYEADIRNLDLRMGREQRNCRANELRRYSNKNDRCTFECPLRIIRDESRFRV